MKDIGIQLEGVQFLVDEHGNCKSVALDLHLWGDLWEDFYDGMLAEATRDEPTIPWEQIKAEMDAELAAESNAAQAAPRSQADIEREYAQATRRAVDRSFPPSRRAIDWDDGALKRELAKMTDEDRREMQAIVDEGLEEDLKHWPEYDAVNGASAEPSPVPSFADRMEALCEQPPSRERAIEMERLLNEATPADKDELFERALAKIDVEYEQRLADEGLEADLREWPEH